MPLNVGGPRRGVRRAALLLTLLAHGLAVHMIAGSSTAPWEQAPKATGQGALLVSLLKEERTAADKTSGSPVQQPSGTSSTTQEKAGKEPQGIVVAQPTGPHYFRLSELTEKPMLQHDAVAELVLRIPGLPPQPVILRLLISEEGGIDRVIVEDSYLALEIEQAVIEAFSRIKFEPGKIGSTAVRSQMRVEAQVESMERLPAVSGTSHTF